MKKIIFKILTALGFIKPAAAVPKPANVVKTIGTNGALKRPVLIAKDETRITMVIDHNFEDILAWAEIDSSRNIFSIVQKSGAVADIHDIIANDDMASFKDYNRVFVVTNFNNKRIMHNLSLVVRDA